MARVEAGILRIPARQDRMNIRPHLLNHRGVLPEITTGKAIQRAIPFPVKVQSLNDQIDMRKAKRCKGIGKRKKRKDRQLKGQRRIAPSEIINTRKTLDGFLLLHSCHVKNPQQAIKSKLSGENIVDVENEDLLFFPNLTYLNVSENRIRLEQLANLRGLRELYMQYNFIRVVQIVPGMFPLLEVLNLGFNSIPAGHILQFAQLPNLRVLDLSGNELCILPEELSSLKKLEELNLSSNNFSSDSVVVEPGKLFKSLSTIPHLKKLNLAHNALKGFHFEYLTSTDLFEPLAELDFSYNKISSQENLLFCQKLKSLQALLITGNPIGINGEYKELEDILYSATSAVIVNHPVPLPNYLRKGKHTEKAKKLPYPKPIASIVVNNTKGVIAKHVYETELSKGIAVTLGEIEATKECDDIFPKGSLQNRQYADIFTPPEAQTDQRIFLTEEEIHAQQINPEYRKMQEEIIEEDLQPENEFQHDIDQGVDTYSNFIRKCAKYLGDKKEYNVVKPISLACKTLKHALKFPTTFIENNNNPHYMKSTLASMINKTSKNQNKETNLEEIPCKFMYI